VDELQREYESAKASFDTAQAELVRANDEADQTSVAERKGAASTLELHQAQDAAMKAHRLVEQAEAHVFIARGNYSRALAASIAHELATDAGALTMGPAIDAAANAIAP